jgi:hypothetical protein
MARGNHAFGGVLADERHRAVGRRIESLGPLRAGQRDQHPFLILDPVVVAQQRVRVGVGREHRVALAQRAAFVLVGVPQAGDAKGFAVGRVLPVGMCTSVRQSGSQKACAGTMQCWALRQALPKVNNLATRSSRALWVASFRALGRLSGCAGREIRPHRAVTGLTRGTASSPASAASGRRTK